MAFYNGSTTIPALLNMMADKLIASDSKFSNPYSGLTRYTGDGTDVDYGITAYQRRVIKWEDPAKSGQEKTMYVAFQIPFYDINQAMFTMRSDSAQYAFGIEVIASSAWDFNTHLPSGDVQRTLLIACMLNSGMSAANRAALMAMNLAYWMWVDDDALSPVKGNGLVVMTKPDTPPWGYGISNCFNMEKMVSKEYMDTYSLWHFETFQNYFPWSGGNQNALTKKWSHVLHPWSQNATIDVNGDTNDYFYITQTWCGEVSNGLNSFTPLGIKGVDFPVWAALSQGGSPPNVYFMKGVVHSEAQYNNKPLSIIQHCFPWREGSGIIDQDVISEPGPSTTKYVCLAKESSHSATKLPMAIKYAY
jgi:hypothetical protein